MMLELQEVNVHYGAIHAVKGVNLEISEGEIVTLIGANGAGKSTVLKAISSLVPCSRGRILYRGEDITRWAPDRIVREGICQVPEGRRIFATLSVRENLELGAYSVGSGGNARAALEQVLGIFPRLGERLKQYAGTLSGGEQQMLAIGRALMSRPKLLLLDEPSLGLAPFLVQDIFTVIREINQKGTSILLVEQNAHMALGVAQRGYVLETGRIVLADSAAKLLLDENVKKAYLGE